MLKKIPIEQSQIILQRFEASPECLDCVDGTMTPSEVIEKLLEAELYNDLTQFLCHALPVREVIWFVCIALELRNKEWSPQQQAAIAIAKKWVKDPDEASRRIAEKHVNALGHDNAPGWLAQAVFWNGSGSMTDPGEAVVLPPENLYAKASAGAINMASIMPEWDGSEDYYKTVIAMGLDLAKGGSGAIQQELGGNA